MFIYKYSSFSPIYFPFILLYIILLENYDKFTNEINNDYKLEKIEDRNNDYYKYLNNDNKYVSLRYI